MTQAELIALVLIAIGVVGIIKTWTPPKTVGKPVAEPAK